MNYVFDVDGTLTPSRQKIDSKFASYFLEFCHRQDVYLVSGSDYMKTEQQLGDDICIAARTVFSCSGNAIYRHGTLRQVSTFFLTKEEESSIWNYIFSSKFPWKTGLHVEKRFGSVNASVLGRGDQTLTERNLYKEWDAVHNERKDFVNYINFCHGDRLEAVLGGETGIDITLRGSNKAQVKDYIHGPITFFGDKCDVGENDYPLAKVVDRFHWVKDWEQTFAILKNYIG